MIVRHCTSPLHPVHVYLQMLRMGRLDGVSGSTGNAVPDGHEGPSLGCLGCVVEHLKVSQYACSAPILRPVGGEACDGDASGFCPDFTQPVDATGGAADDLCDVEAGLPDGSLDQADVFDTSGAGNDHTHGGMDLLAMMDTAAWRPAVR